MVAFGWADLHEFGLAASVSAKLLEAPWLPERSAPNLDAYSMLIDIERSQIPNSENPSGILFWQAIAFTLLSRFVTENGMSPRFNDRREALLSSRCSRNISTQGTIEVNHLGNP